MYQSYRDAHANVDDEFIRLIRRGDYEGVRRARTPRKTFVETAKPLKLAVRLYLENFTSRNDNRWRQTLVAVVGQIKKSGASLFPHTDNALHQLARQAKNQEQYDAVARVFREHVGDHFRKAHTRLYVNSEHTNERLHGRLSRASSFLLARGIDASNNRPETHMKARLGPSRILANIGNVNTVHRAPSARVNQLSDGMRDLNLDARLRSVIAQVMREELNRREATRSGVNTSKRSRSNNKKKVRVRRVGAFSTK